MDINKIEITNFRSINNKNIISPVNGCLLVFVGQNNVGKSNYLRAINLFFNKFIEPGIFFNSNKDFNKLSDKKNTTISLEILFDPLKDKQITDYIDKKHSIDFNGYLLPITLTISSNNKFQYSFRVKKGQRRSYPEFIDRILLYVNCIYIPSIKNYKNIINNEFLKQIVSFTFQGWGRGRTSKKIGEQRKKFEASITDLQKLLDDTGVVASDIIKSVIPDINSFHFALPYENLEEFLGKLNLEITEKIFSHKISLENEGSGIQSFVIYTMLRLLHELRPSNSIENSAFIWLIEEPETFMHNDLQRKTKEKLQAYSKDGLIYITTHSPIFINKNELINVYWVDKKNESVLRKLSQKDLSEFLSQSLGIKLQDYFILNRYNILVEGESDSNILTGLLKIYKAKGYLDIPNFDLIKFIICKSTTSISHFYSLYNSFNQYASFYVIVDGDKAGDIAIEHLRKNGVENKYIIQIKDTHNKSEPEIEDLLDNDLWEICLKDLDSKGLITIKSKQDKIIDYEYEPKNREKVKIEFSRRIIQEANNDLSKYTHYHDLLKNLKILFDNE